MSIQFADNARTTLAEGVTSLSKTLVVCGTKNFPVLRAGDTFIGGLFNPGMGGGYSETIEVYQMSDNVLQVNRAIGNAEVAKDFPAGSIFEITLNATFLRKLLQESHTPAPLSNDCVVPGRL